MTIALNRRHFLGGSAVAAGLATVPARLLAAQSPAAWNAVRKSLQSFVDTKYVPGVVGLIGRGTEAPDVLKAGTLAFDNATPVDEHTLFRCYSMIYIRSGPTQWSAPTWMRLISEGYV